MVEDFLIRHPRIKCILLAGGFPCQDLSGANPTGKGVKGSQSSLFLEFLRVRELVEKAAKKFGMAVGSLLENVKSMDAK
eukprot:3969013-Karenia_brevis.AAC.1